MQEELAVAKRREDELREQEADQKRRQAEELAVI